MVDAASPLFVDAAHEIRGKRVLAIEDGPTLTHGEMKYGAGVLAALRHGAAELVDPRPYAVGRIAETFASYPGIGALLPAMGYGEEQTRDLEATIARTPCDLVLVATPIDLRRVLRIDKPTKRVTLRAAGDRETGSRRRARQVLREKRWRRGTSCRSRTGRATSWSCCSSRRPRSRRAPTATRTRSRASRSR